MAGAIAAEARAQGAHIGHGPILDLVRKPRWSIKEVRPICTWLIAKLLKVVGVLQAGRKLPQWFVGRYGRSIAMKGANKYTSVLSIQMRRLGWQHGGRIIGDVSAVAAFTSLAVDNGYYYNDIIQGKQSFDQVQEHYDDVTLSPMFWLYKRIEPWLISLGEPNK